MVGGGFSGGAFGADVTQMNMTGPTSFASIPAAASLNAYFSDRYLSPGPGTNIQIEDMRPSEQRLGMEPLDATGEPHPIDVTALVAAKGLSYLHESMWQTRTERKLPPMPQSVFDGMFKATTTAVRNHDHARKPTDDYNDDDLNDDDPLPL
jgi:hypothetical protein